MKDIKKYQGCLLGGAVGDALGYAVEFLREEQIFRKYGARGITEYALVNGVAQISDDTQMTLYTANGLLLAATGEMTGCSKQTYRNCLTLCYQDWLKTQGVKKQGTEKPEASWLNNVPEMNHSRAPGMTCLNYLMCNNLGSTSNPKNTSKGCGGVMRVAPIGLFFEDNRLSADEIAMLGAEAAALTHGHELGYIPAATLAYIVHAVSHSDTIGIEDALTDAMQAVERLFPAARHLPEFLKLMQKAIALSKDSMDDIAAIHQLGEGWVAEQTLAIAVYCALKYQNNFEQAIIAAVNHDGDSDSTGAVTGNILGAYLGADAIAEKFLTQLELRDVILEMANDLFFGCDFSEHNVYREDVWKHKYLYHDYAPRIAAQ